MSDIDDDPSIDNAEHDKRIDSIRRLLGQLALSGAGVEAPE